MENLFIVRDGKAVPELTPGMEWVLAQPSVVHRYHSGTLVKYSKRLWFKRWYIPVHDEWMPIHLNNWAKLEEALELPPFDSGINEYLPGVYILTSINDTPRLVSDQYAVQLGNFQSLELHLVKSVEQAYNDIKDVFSYVEEDIIVFKSLDFKQRVQLQRSNF